MANEIPSTTLIVKPINASTMVVLTDVIRFALFSAAAAAISDGLGKIYGGIPSIRTINSHPPINRTNTTIGGRIFFSSPMIGLSSAG
ncbi:hypothetical protein D3C74_372500 [compost metagenome]